MLVLMLINLNFESLKYNEDGLILYLTLYITGKTRSTQRAQTSLAEADHYSHIAYCKNVELGYERLPTP